MSETVNKTRLKTILKKITPKKFRSKIPLFMKEYTGKLMLDAAEAYLKKHTEGTNKKFQVSEEMNDSRINDDVVLPLLDKVIRYVCVTCEGDNISMGIYTRTSEIAGFVRTRTVEDAGFVRVLFNGRHPQPGIIFDTAACGDKDRAKFYTLEQDAKSLGCELSWHRGTREVSLEFEFPIKVAKKKQGAVGGI